MQRLSTKKILALILAINLIIVGSAGAYVQGELNNMNEEQQTSDLLIGAQELVIQNKDAELAQVKTDLSSLNERVANSERVILDTAEREQDLKAKYQAVNDERLRLANRVIKLKDPISIAETQPQAPAIIEPEVPIEKAQPQIELAASSGKRINVKATAYIAMCNSGCTGITATGIDVRNYTPKLIAVDPRVIPLGSKVELIVKGKSWGTYLAGDTGGAIKGNKIDILMSSRKKAIAFGKQSAVVRIIKKGNSG